MSARKNASRRNIAAIARSLAPDAIERIRQLMGSETESVALQAAQHILDRAIGKPVAMSADVTDRLDEFSDDELDAAISDIKSRLAAAGNDGADESPPSRPH